MSDTKQLPAQRRAPRARRLSGGSPSLAVRLYAAFLLVSVIGAVVAAAFVYWATQRAFDSVVLNRAQSQFVSEVTTYYLVHQSWDGVGPTIGAEQRDTLTNDPNHPPPVPFVLVDAQGTVVVPSPMYPLGTQATASAIHAGAPVRVNGQVVGTVLAPIGSPPLGRAETDYLTRTTQALAIGAAVAVLVALGLGLVLARSLTRPLRELTTAIQAMRSGQLKQQVHVGSHDELGRLAQAFNELSADLTRENSLRRQMTADIAHDLRTPVTVIAGYLEALRDGVLPPTEARFTALYEESQRLLTLIEDLRLLSLADAGELALDPSPMAPQTLLERAADRFVLAADRQDVRIETQAQPDLPPLEVDERRMAQVLDNLVSNALRHTPAGGLITLRARRDGDTVALLVEDTGSGVPPDVLPNLFERFVRGDASRTRDVGGSGLGLAIARVLVEAHGGTITARNNEPSGATFEIRLPARAPFTRARARRNGTSEAQGFSLS